MNHTEARVPLPGLLDVAREVLLAEFQRELHAAGYDDIRPNQGCVFRFVRDEGLRLTDLAQLAGMTKQSAGELVDDLVERGYVERVPDPVDRRAKLIQLTAKGVEAQRFGFELFASLEKRWAERYGEREIATLRELLEEIVAAEAPEAVPELARAQLASV